MELVREEESAEGLPVIPASRSEPALTPRQSEVRMELYRRLAAMLPTEGRDYSFSVSFPDGGDRPSVRFVPMNDLGRIWCNYALGEFRKMVK